MMSRMMTQAYDDGQKLNSIYIISNPKSHFLENLCDPLIVVERYRFIHKMAIQ